MGHPAAAHLHLRPAVGGVRPAPGGGLRALRADPGGTTEQVGSWRSVGGTTMHLTAATSVEPRGHRVSGGRGRRTGEWCCACDLTSSDRGLSRSRSRPPVHDRHHLGHGRRPHRPARSTTPPRPKSPTVAARTNAVSVESPKPSARNGGIQCCQKSSSSAITAPPTALSMNAGPTTSASLHALEPQVEVDRRRNQYRCCREQTHVHHMLPSREGLTALERSHVPTAFAFRATTVGLDRDDRELADPASGHPVAPEPVRGQQVVERRAAPSPPRWRAGRPGTRR